MHIDESIVEMLMNIHWLENCSQNSKLNIRYGYEFVSLEKVKQSLTGVKWQNRQLEEVNKLTEYLFFNNPEVYHDCWNKLVNEFKEKYITMLDELVIEKVNDKFGSLSKFVMDSIHYDALEIAMAFTYKDYLAPTFYAQILKVYQNGFFPCGWRGKFPHGNMLIY